MEDAAEDLEQRDGESTSLEKPEDLGHHAPGRNKIEKVAQHEEKLNLLDKEADPEGEKKRKTEWRKLSRAKRVGFQ